MEKLLKNPTSTLLWNNNYIQYTVELYVNTTAVSQVSTRGTRESPLWAPRGLTNKHHKRDVTQIYYNVTKSADFCFSQTFI